MSIEAHVLGCGEAFDETLPNTSLLIRAGSLTCLLDCGYSVPPVFWRTVPDANALDLIYISHGHADHYYGMPALITRMWEEKRSKPLTIVSQADLNEALPTVIEGGYAGILAKLPFPIRFVDAQPGNTLDIEGLQLNFAPTIHAVPNLAVRLKYDGASLFYSGDGAITPESRVLAEGVDVLIHEAFKFEDVVNHASIPDVIELARSAKRGALVHLQRSVRRHKERVYDELARSNTLLPEPGEVLYL